MPPPLSPPTRKLLSCVLLVGAPVLGAACGSDDSAGSGGLAVADGGGPCERQLCGTIALDAGTTPVGGGIFAFDAGRDAQPEGGGFFVGDGGADAAPSDAGGSDASEKDGGADAADGS